MSLRLYTGVSLGRERVIPDAFHFDHERKVLTLYEVEVTHMIADDAGKLGKLQLIRDVLSSLGWRLRVRLGYPGDVWRPMDWATGQPRISSNEMRATARLLDGAP